MRDIRDRTDIIALALGCAACLDGLVDEFSPSPERNVERRKVLGIFKDSLDLYCELYNNPKPLNSHLKTLSAIPWNFVFTKYEEIYVLNEFSRENPDLALKEVSSNLRKFLDCETSEEQSRGYARKLIPFFLKIQGKCNQYVENPPAAFLPGYIPPGLIRGLMLREAH